MKIFITTFCATLALLTAQANEDLLALYELNQTAEIASTNQNAEATVGEYSRFCSELLFQIETTTDVLTTRVTACRNTFIYYIWNDADNAKGKIERFKIVRDIQELTK